MKDMGVRVGVGVVLGGLLAAGAGGYLATRAWAIGIPRSPGTLYYSGEISRYDGAAVPASAEITVRLFDRLDTTGDVELCAVGPVDTDIEDGHFRVPLDEGGYTACVDAIRTHPDVWVEVEVGSETMARQHVGAVPYAIEAERATRLAQSTVCGYTANTDGSFASGAAIGVEAANALCAGVAACGDPGAHICTADEAARATIGARLTPPTGHAWVMGTADYDITGSDGVRYRVGDCNSWSLPTTPGVRSMYGSAIWTGTTVSASRRISNDYCEVQHPIACCR